MRIHWHGSIENILFTGISAIVVINLGRLAGQFLVRRGGRMEEWGKALGSLL